MLIVVMVILRNRCNRYFKLNENQTLPALILPLLVNIFSNKVAPNLPNNIPRKSVFFFQLFR